MTKKKPEPQMTGSKFRAEGISDKDAPNLYGAVLGLPGRELYALWDAKINLEDLWAETEQEDLHIAKARELFFEELTTTSPMSEERVYVENQAMPFIRACLDAACLDGSVLAKFVVLQRDAFDQVKNNHSDLRGGRISERHWIEIQHQLAASGIRKAYYVATVDGTAIANCVVRPDPVFISNHIAECVQFWDYVRRGAIPPKAEVPDEEQAAELDPNQSALPLKNPPKKIAKKGPKK